jgi:hypothetical protein
MAAIEGGTAEKLIDSYELDVGRAWLIITKIKQDPGVILGEPFDPNDPNFVPAWAPRKFDNIAVHKQVFGDWMKTADYDSLPPIMQEAANLYYDALEWLEAQKAQAMVDAQNAQAEALGSANAAKGPGLKPMPSLPGVSTPLAPVGQNGAPPPGQ